MIQINKALKELIIKLEEIDPVEFLGVNNAKFKIIQSAYPNLKILTRGSEIKAQGPEEELQEFKDKVNELVSYFQSRKHLPENIIDKIMGSESVIDNEFVNEDTIIMHGPDNKIIKTRTPTQYKLLKAMDHNDIVFSIGPAGTGKTYTSVAIAVKALKNKEVKKIVLTRPAVEAGEKLGFLPGDMREKIDPYLRPLYDALFDMLPPEKLNRYLDRKTIEVAPLAFMRGRTLDNAYVILDEAQNCSILQLKMFLTRMGPNAKFMINGDLTQIDLPPSQKSGLLHATNLLKDVKGIKVLEFTVEDVTRHPLVKRIINAYAKKIKD